MQQRMQHGRPAKSYLVPALTWSGVAVVAIAVALLIANEAIHPIVVKDPSALPKATGSTAYSISALHKRLPPEALNTVQQYVDFFTTKQRRRVQDGLARSGRYLETYRQIFHNEGIPEELVYLPMIESGYMETAVSPARAVGVWQFIEETGKRFNLDKNDWYDSRLDPIASARSAAKLLKTLYDQFGDWDLALAAYNSGSGTVKWAQRVNGKVKQPQNYWALELPEETRNYVPAFIAMVLIAKNPSAFGFNEIQFHAKIVFDQVKVSPGMSLVDFAQHAGVDLNRVLELNPELLKAEIPPVGKPYNLRVPAGTKGQILDRIAGVKSMGQADYVIYLVQQTDTVETLANWANGVAHNRAPLQSRAELITKTNRLADDADLTKRQYVVIPL
ncbi:MAG TPA: lytic transglycosylase domain-containing protein [bacterium]